MFGALKSPIKAFVLLHFFLLNIQFETTNTLILNFSILVLHLTTTVGVKIKSAS
jgi:hypothetical protein